MIAILFGITWDAVASCCGGVYSGGAYSGAALLFIGYRVLFVVAMLFV